MSEEQSRLLKIEQSQIFVVSQHLRSNWTCGQMRSLAEAVTYRRFTAQRRRLMKTAVRISGYHLQPPRLTKAYCTLALGILIFWVLLTLSFVPADFDVIEHTETISSGDKPHPCKDEVSSKVPKTINSVAIREMNIERFENRQKHAKHHKTLSESVSIIAACKDRTAALEATLPSWRRVYGVSEIVLVDYGSRDPSAVVSLMNSLSVPDLDVGEVFIRMADSHAPWSLSRAYNLAASISFGKLIVKVDCDTVLAPNFLDLHPLGRTHGRTFYTTNWSKVLGNPLVGVFVMDRLDFERSAGYDERIVSHGGESVDLYNRLVHRHGLHYKELNGSVCHHLSHENLSPPTRRPISTVTSGKENILAVTSLRQKWTLSAKRDLGTTFALFDETPKQNRWLKADRILRRSIIRASATRWSPDALGLLSDDEMNRVQSLAVEEALSSEFHVPAQIVSQLSAFAASQLLSLLHNGPQAAAVFVELSGPSLADRILGLCRAIGLGHALRRPLVVYWLPLTNPLRFQGKHVTLDDLFDLQGTNEELEQVSMKTYVFDGGQQWPCAELHSRDCANLDKQFIHITDIRKPGPAIARPGRYQHLHLRLGSYETEGDVLPFKIRSPYERYPHSSGLDKTLATALHVLVLPKEVSSGMRQFVASARESTGIFHSLSLPPRVLMSLENPNQVELAAMLAFTGAGRGRQHSIIPDGSINPMGKKLRFAIDGPASFASSQETRSILATNQDQPSALKCNGVGSLDQDTSCAQESLADLFALLHSKAIFWTTELDGEVSRNAALAKVGPGGHALYAMRAAIHRSPPV